MELVISIPLFDRPLKAIKGPPLPFIDTIHYLRHVKINQVKPILAVDEYIVGGKVGVPYARGMHTLDQYMEGLVSRGIVLRHEAARKAVDRKLFM